MDKDKTELDYHAIVTADYGALDLPGLLRAVADDLELHDSFHQSPCAVQLREIEHA